MANFHMSGNNPKQLEGAISWQIKALQALMTSGSRSLELKRSNFRIDNRNNRFMKAGQVDSHECQLKSTVMPKTTKCSLLAKIEKTDE